MKRVHWVLVCVLLLSACAAKETKLSERQIEEALIQYSFAHDFYVNNELIRASAAAERSVALNPASPQTYNLLGLIYFRQERYQEAEKSFKKGLAIKEDMPDIWNNLGTLYYVQERYEEAEGALRKALDYPLYLYPENIYNNLGLVYSRMQKPTQAAQSFEQAIRLRPEYYLPYQNLGKLFVEQKEFRRALPILEKAVRMCPRCPEPRYYLGLVFLESNRESAALAQFKKGAEMDPNGYFGQLCRQFLVDQNESAL